MVKLFCSLFGDPIRAIVTLTLVSEIHQSWLCTTTLRSKGRSYHFRFGIIFLKKYHVTATRFKPKKSILHKNKNEIVSPKKYHENSTVTGWLQSCAYPSRLPSRLIR